MTDRFLCLALLATAMLLCGCWDLYEQMERETPAERSARLIPPEVLAQMDPDIVSGARPVFYQMTQEDLFALRERPRLAADLVRFRFSTQTLSSVQRKLLTQWVRAGHNTVFLEGNQMGEFAWLLPGVEVHWLRPDDYSLSAKLSEHPVRSDCEHVRFTEDDRGRKSSQRLPTFTGLPAGSEVVAAAPHVVDLDDWPQEDKRVRALAGAAKVGKGTVYFSAHVRQSPDSQRWLLNFRHWMLGKPIPPPTVVKGDRTAE